jgi:hypothetical protein
VLSRISAPRISAPDVLLPLELGEPLSFKAEASSAVPDCQGACPGSFPHSGSASIGYTYEFFEADGVTPGGFGWLSARAAKSGFAGAWFVRAAVAAV